MSGRWHQCANSTWTKATDEEVSNELLTATFLYRLARDFGERNGKSKQLGGKATSGCRVVYSTIKRIEGEGSSLSALLYNGRLEDYSAHCRIGALGKKQYHAPLGNVQE